MGAITRPVYDLEDLLRMSIHEARAKRLEREQMSTAIQKTSDVTPELVVWRAMREQAKELVVSGFLPKSIRTPEQAMAIIQTGHELGLGPMQALRTIHIIEGKPCMSADLIAGLALRNVPGAVLRVAETTDKFCTVEANRAGQQVTKFRFSMTRTAPSPVT